MFFRSSHWWHSKRDEWIHCAKEDLLELQDYRQIINLDQPWIQVQKQELLSPMEQDKLTRELLARFTGQTSAANQAGRRKASKAYLVCTINPNHHSISSKQS